MNVLFFFLWKCNVLLLLIIVNFDAKVLITGHDIVSGIFLCCNIYIVGVYYSYMCLCNKCQGCLNNFLFLFLLTLVYGFQE